MKRAKLYKVVEECVTVSGDWYDFSRVNLPTPRIEQIGDEDFYEAYHVDADHVSTPIRSFHKADTSWVDNKYIETIETSYVILDPVLESYVETLVNDARRERQYEVENLEGRIRAYKEISDNCRKEKDTAADSLCKYRNSFDDYHKEITKVRIKDAIGILLVGVVAGALAF